MAMSGASSVVHSEPLGAEEEKSGLRRIAGVKMKRVRETGCKRLAEMWNTFLGL
jgi:hypothetical protein